MNMRTKKARDDLERRGVGKGHKSRSACWVSGMVWCYEEYCGAINEMTQLALHPSRYSHTGLFAL